MMRCIWTLSAKLTVVVAVVATWTASSSAAVAKDTRPNILFIITDQQQAGMMSCAGERFVETPALDRLAAAGTRFERAYPANPVCIPSRIAMMTGRMPSHYGMRSNAEGRNMLPEGDLKHTLGWVFRGAGYDTVYGGKTHWFRNMNPQSIGFTMLTRDQREGLAADCVKFFQSEHERPFLLVASFINPHDICYMAIDSWTKAKGQEVMYPQSRVERQRLAQALQLPTGVSRSRFFEEFAPPLPDNFAVPRLEPEAITNQYLNARGFRAYARGEWTAEQWRLHRWAYRRLTEMVDAHIGKVLSALDGSPYGRSTVVVFTSDHGDLDAAHGLEHKSILYEEAARVPLIVRGPNVKQGRVDDQHLISVGLDLIPTLCDFAGIDPPGDCLGHSFRPLAEGREPASWPDQVVVESKAGRMLRTGKFKYVVYQGGAHREQLIDLNADPGEMNNLAEMPQYRDVLNDHRRRLHKWVVETHDEIAKPYVLDAP